MPILKIVAFAFIALFIFLVFKDRRSDIAVLISLVAGVAIFIVVASQLGEIILFFKDVANKAGMDIVYVGIILKIIAIAYLSSFASEICKDAGASAIGSKVEFAGKIFILLLAIPILMSVLESILQIL
ncbi:stage III sporulation protein AD [Clostridium thermobutyricum]|uniref:Stage III sporulation protein AC/AD protein family protein n=1 Tax=Clostridium thermobutyricum DSM 4928 TaxID=1121339 RepID=A0A1V4SV34_9CLOT|nr:stage III sporulation protein AD [Clostridium thermobutyricum]OPX47880.1 stage III sporulation protein AC/AD protein family protein [Clostridium thermobutyricum DSM 4928]